MKKKIAAVLIGLLLVTTAWAIQETPKWEVTTINKAARVLEVTYGNLAYSIKQSPRVFVIEPFHMGPGELRERQVLINNDIINQANLALTHIDTLLTKCKAGKELTQIEQYIAEQLATRLSTPDSLWAVYAEYRINQWINP